MATVSDLLNGVQDFELLLVKMTGPVLAHGHSQTISPMYIPVYNIQGHDSRSLPQQSPKLGVRPMILRSVL